MKSKKISVRVFLMAETTWREAQPGLGKSIDPKNK